MGMRAVASALVAAAIALVVLGVCDDEDGRDAQIGPYADTPSLDGDAIDGGPGDPPSARGPARAKRSEGGGAAAKPAAAGGELCLIVRDEQRTRLEGARVHVAAADGRTFDARTDAQGEALLRALPVGNVVATVRHEGHAPGELTVSLTEGSRENRSITLTPGISVNVRVVRDDDDTPVAGAYVAVANGRLGASGEPVAERFAIDAETTAADGTAWLAGGAEQNPQVVTARAPGFARAAACVRPDGAGRATVELRLEAAGALTGRVLDAEDRPARAEVQLFVAGTIGSAETEPVASTKTTKDGRFRFEDLPLDGLFDVRAEAEPGVQVEGCGGPSAALFRVRPSRGEMPDVHLLRLPAPSRVSFRIADRDLGTRRRDEPSGEDAETPSVLLVRLAPEDGAPGNSPTWEGALDSVVHVGAGRWLAVLVGTTPGPRGHAQFDVAPGADVTVSFTAHETCALPGRVVNTQGRGIEGVRVVAAHAEFPEKDSAISGASGTFSLEPLRAGRWELSVNTPGLIAAPVVVEIPRDEPATAGGTDERRPAPEVTLTVVEGASFVVDFPDNVRGQRMQVRFDRRLPPGAVDDDGETPDGWRHAGYVDGDCRAARTWGPCAPGDWRVVVRVVGFRPWVREYQVTDGTTQVVDVEGLDAAVAITGTVVDKRGAPVAGASVQLRDGWWDSTSQATRADGVFTPLAAPPGRAVLEVTARGYADSRVEIDAAPGLAPLRLVLHRGGVAAIEVRRADGSRATGVPVLATRPDGTEMNRWYGEIPTTDARGVYRLNAAPGKYRVEIGETTSIDVEIEDEKTTTWTATVR